LIDPVHWNTHLRNSPYTCCEQPRAPRPDPPHSI